MIVISQPTYLPWIGYFSLINAADHFIFLDDVQFDSRSWQQRNRILINGNVNYLTVPVIKKGLSKQLINNTTIASNDVFKKHLLKIKHAYSKTKYFKEYYPKIENIITKCNNMINLSEINIHIIKEITKILNLKCEFTNSSELDCPGKRSLKLINICNKLKKNDYLINEGSKKYVNEDISLFKKNNIKIYTIKYNDVYYEQFNDVFVKKLSIIDVLFNKGPETINFIKNNYKLISFDF